jgi:outer membrane protein TolC
MRLSVLVVVVFAAPGITRAGPPLTLERVQALAVQNQPALVAGEAGAQGTREAAIAEGQLPDPRLKLGLMNVPIETFALNRDPMTQTMVGIEQMIPGGNKRELRRRRGEAEAQQMTAELEAQRNLIQRDAALAFLALQGTKRQLAVLGDLHRQTEQLAEAARIGTLAGRGQVEVYAARQMLTMTRDRASELAMQEAKARAELGRWIGPAAQDEVTTVPVTMPAPAALASLRESLQRHPTHAAQARSVAMAEAELALAREAKSPDKSIEFGYGKRSRNFDDMVSIQFAMELPVFPADRQDRSIAAKRAQMLRASAMREDHLRMLAAELSATYAEWELTQERLKRIELELLPNAVQRVDAALAAYRSGRGELSPVLEARRAELEARLQRVQLETQLQRARLQLAYFEHAGDRHE